MYSRWKDGFTLIELLIVVAIIGILAAIAVPNFLNAQIRAKIASTKSDLRTMFGAMQQYHLDNNSYHAHRDGFGQQFPLTTPVPYLNQFLFDRFQAAPNMHRAAGFQNSETHYHWIPCSSHMDLWNPIMHEQIREAHTTRNAGLIDGWGPAGIRGGPIYDPSNGLNSRGGFFRKIPAGSNIHLHNSPCDG